MVALNEADTCRRYVLPKLVDAGWDSEPHSFTEQKTFTDGRTAAGDHIRQEPKADMLKRLWAKVPTKLPLRVAGTLETAFTGES